MTYKHVSFLLRQNGKCKYSFTKAEGAIYPNFISTSQLCQLLDGKTVSLTCEQKLKNKELDQNRN